MIEQTMADARARLRADGWQALSGGEVPWLTLAAELVRSDPRAQELAGYGALADGEAGWGCVCLSEAGRRYRAAGASLAAEWVEGLEAQVRSASFPAFEDDGGLLGALGAWLRLRVQDVAGWMAGEGVESPEQGRPPESAESAARYLTWSLRLRSTRLGGGSALRLAQLGSRLGLDEVDQLWLGALLALERDLLLQRKLQVELGTSGRCSAGMWALVLARQPGDEVALLARLDAGRPLVGLSLVHLNPPAERPRSGRRHAWLEVDDAVTAWVDGGESTPGGVEGAVRAVSVVAPTYGASIASRVESLERALRLVEEGGVGGNVAICSLSEASGRLWVASAAHRLGRAVVEASVGPVLAGRVALDVFCGVSAREARLRGALLFVVGVREAEAHGRAVAEALDRWAVLGGATPVLFDAPLDGIEVLRQRADRLYEVRWMLPTMDEQVRLWDEAILGRTDAGIDDATLRAQIAHPAMDASDIETTVQLALNQTRLLQGRGIDVATLSGLVSSRRSQALSGVANRVRTSLGWGDVVLPDAVLTGLMEIITYARYHRKVYEEWGFAAKMPYGRSNSSLFTGPPGTGKTMMAGLVARELGMELFQVDVSQIISKWVGETEKNLSRIFDEASRSHAVLLFDEADSLFGKRTHVKSSNDRYSNLEVNYLLQRIEAFDGITILTTNYPDNIDDAFARRIRFKVEFPFPEPEERARLWEVCLPPGADVDAGVDFAALGRQFELAGGHIKNAVIRAAFHAAEEGCAISAVLLREAATTECRALGKLVRVSGA